MSSNWTSEQEAAIAARDCNLLVAAAAGSGKTAVLVERIIRRLTEKDAQDKYLDVDNLLVVTFTNAAAAEMRQRIATALVRRLNGECNGDTGDKTLINHLNRQLAIIGSASITTLHSFCLDIVRKYFYILDLDPEFRIASEHEIELLKQEVLEELFEEAYKIEDTAFLGLVDCYGGERGDELLSEVILKLQNFARSMPWPEKWLKELVKNYQVEEDSFDSLEWVRELLKTVGLELAAAKEKLLEGSIIAGFPGGPTAYQENFQEDLALIEGFITAKSWRRLSEELQSFSAFGRLKRIKAGTVDEELAERAKDLRNEAKDIIYEIKKKYFVKPVTEVIADINALSEHVAALIKITIDFNNAFAEGKKEKALVDFNDLEHFCLRILLAENSQPGQEKPSFVALNLREKFAEVMVDEYQDINPMQESILQMVSRQQDEATPNLFMVGDVKQSIYRFRLTEPRLFMEKYRSYMQEAGSFNRRIDLAKNFRSRASVLEATNFIFRQIMAETIGEINYDEQAELKKGANYLESEQTAKPTTELHILERNTAATEAILENDANQEEPLEELEASQLEARFVAARIHQLMGHAGSQALQVLDKHTNTYRDLAFKDIVILLRATKGWANTFLEEFRSQGIPAYAELGSGYFEAIEIETMLALLQVIDNPRQDIPLAAVLRSPIVGLNANELSVVRLANLRGDYYDALKLAAQTDEELAQEHFAMKLKINTFLDRLENWRTLARQEALATLIWQIYRETGYYDYVGGMPGGGQRQANLRAFYDRALEYEKTNLRGLFRFLRFIERIREKGNDLGAARSLGENEDVVRIMSIHKSKGLEFPVVFVAGSSKRFNLMDINSKFLLHKERGIALDIIDLDLRVACSTLYKKSLQQKMRIETLAEEMRMLYVAMTRAKEKLILVGSLKNASKESAKWAKCAAHREWSLPDYETAKAVSYMHWLGIALIRHRDGKVLRNLAGSDISPTETTMQDSSSWEIYLHDRAAITGNVIEEITDETLEQIKELKPLTVKSDNYHKIEAWLSWEYPYLRMTQIAAKTSVTELKRRFDPLVTEHDQNQQVQKQAFVRPRFLQKDKGLSSSERGTAVHLAMQHILPAGEIKAGAIRQQIEKLVEKEILTPEQAKIISVQAIIDFLCSDLGKRVQAADKLHKELPFTLAVPLARLHQDLHNLADAGEKVIVQGVIDCLIEEEDGLVLIDYKTDSCKPGQEAEIAARYKGQLKLYATAVESILKKPVKEKWLYLFSLGKCLQLSERS